MKKHKIIQYGTDKLSVTEGERFVFVCEHTDMKKIGWANHYETLVVMKCVNDFIVFADEQGQQWFVQVADDNKPKRRDESYKLYNGDKEHMFWIMRILRLDDHDTLAKVKQEEYDRQQTVLKTYKTLGWPVPEHLNQT